MTTRGTGNKNLERRCPVELGRCYSKKGQRDVRDERGFWPRRERSLRTIADAVLSGGGRGARGETST